MIARCSPRFKNGRVFQTCHDSHVPLYSNKPVGFICSIVGQIHIKENRNEKNVERNIAYCNCGDDVL